LEQPPRVENGATFPAVEAGTRGFITPGIDVVLDEHTAPQ